MQDNKTQAFYLPPIYHTARLTSMPVADVNCIEAKGNKNDLQCSIDRQNFASSIFFAYSALRSLHKASADIRSISVCGTEMKVLDQ